jgi:hypothetical protein
MFTRFHKSKQYLLAALKVLILGVTFGYIYVKITDNNSLDFKKLIEILIEKDNTAIVFIILFVLLAALNWIFEILKWKTVVSALEKINFKTAMQQCLASLTVSLATPNRIGDYGAKALFYEATNRKQILLLNFYTNGIQMLITILFGIIGLVLISLQYKIEFSASKIILGGIILVAIAVFGIIYKEKQLVLKGLSLANIWRYFKKLPLSIKFKTILYSVIRYLIFSFLFFLLLLFFKTEITFHQAIPLILAMYLLVSIVPSIFIFDVVIRGGVAVWLFSFSNIPELPVLCTVFSMWLLNFVVPAIWGSFYVITYKAEKV